MYDENGNEVKRGGCLKWIGIGIIALIALFIIGSLFSDGKKSVNTESSESQTSESKSSDKKENKKLAVGDAAEIDGIKI
ncbi:hypothetical protein [Aerococcus mictus]|uniref:hypothetical protein n=1 Tax=Aerococcus mictus TaxID=2976810 RepID=UPI0022783386|nr:hypothetical protein [Aerococcus mictus]MCY3086317.1 hypothetical protein [Aerococcus mictus]